MRHDQVLVQEEVTPTGILQPLLQKMTIVGFYGVYLDGDIGIEKPFEVKLKLLGFIIRKVEICRLQVIRAHELI